MVSEKRDIFGPLSERWQHQRNDIKPVIKILTKRAFFNSLFEVTVGYSYNSDICLMHLCGADYTVLFLLKEAQKLGLQRERETVNVIQDNRPTFRFRN